MNVQAWKRWQWVIVGILAGLAVASARLLAASDRRVGGEEYISQIEFERALNMTNAQDEPEVSRLVIRPDRYVDLVSLRRRVPETSTYETRLFAAQRPYRPLGQANPPSDYSVSQFLAKNYPKLSFSTAWWDAPVAMSAIYAAIGALVIGGIWPSILGMLVGAGLGRKEPDCDLSRFKSEPVPQPQKQELTDAERRHLEELEEEMAAGLKSAGSETAAPAAAPVSAVKELGSDAVEATPAPDAEQKDYAGQYYPVEKKVPHGFTLIELLVVMGIIAVLTAILLPAVRTARLRAQTIKCQAQLRQFGQAFQAYANANDGWLPAWSAWHTWPVGLSEDSYGPAWTIEMIPYIGAKPDSPVYNCPSFPGPIPCRNYFMAAQWSGKSNKRAMKLSDVKDSSTFVLSGDKTQRGLYPKPFGTSEHFMDDADPDDYGGESAEAVLAWPWDPGGFFMHRGGNNVLFLDGHVSLFDGYDPLRMTFNPHRPEDWFYVTPN